MTIDIIFYGKGTKIRSINMCASNFHHKIMDNIPEELTDKYDWSDTVEITDERFIELLLYSFRVHDYFKDEQEYIDFVVWIEKITVRI